MLALDFHHMLSSCISCLSRMIGWEVFWSKIEWRRVAIWCWTSRLPSLFKCSPWFVDKLLSMSVFKKLMWQTYSLQLQGTKKMQAVQKNLSQSGAEGSPSWCWGTFHIKLHLTSNIRKSNTVYMFPLEFHAASENHQELSPLAIWHTFHQAAVGGYSLQMWWVAANIFNKQWQTAKKGWLSIFRVAWKNQNVAQFYSMIYRNTRTSTTSPNKSLTATDLELNNTQISITDLDLEIGTLQPFFYAHLFPPMWQ